MHFMYDLDNTLIDTRAVKPFMKTQQGRFFAAQNINRIATVANETLRIVLERQHKRREVSIVTDAPEDYARAVLQKHGFPKDIPIYAAANKPFNRGLAKAIIDCKKPLEEIVVIGDSAKDILDAHQANIKSIGVLWGNLFTQEQLDLAEPTAVVESPEDLEGMLASDRIAKEKYEPRKNPSKLLYFPQDQRTGAALDITHITLGPYTSWSTYGSEGFSALSARILKFKMMKDHTVEGINNGASDEYYCNGQLRKGEQLLGVFWSLQRELIEKLKEIEWNDCLVVAAPNSLPAYCYRSDINELFIRNAFKEKEFITTERFVFRAFPKQEDHRGLRSPEEVHYRTVGLQKASKRKFNQIILFDDVRTTGAQTSALARILRYYGLGEKFYIVTFGQTT